MTFLVQFKRLRRGVPEVVRTTSFAAVDGAAALAHARSLAGTRYWPVGTYALRVMDDRGRTLLEWTVPPVTVHPSTSVLRPAPAEPTNDKLQPEPPIATDNPEESPSKPALGRHLFAVGQPVSYGEDGRPDIWKGGYEIVRLDDPLHELRYAIRNADQSNDRIVHERELREDLGARSRGL